ncbi:heme-binding protein [Shouchella patagoniensis]
MELNLHMAKQLIAAAEAEAESVGVKMVISIVDSG